jgi:hypothetical protein
MADRTTQILSLSSPRAVLAHRSRFCSLIFVTATVTSLVDTWPSAYFRLKISRSSTSLHVSSTSTSNSSIIARTTAKLSMKPLTATRSILLVEALYSVRSTVLSQFASEAGATRDNERHTSGESSLSTCRACRADDARRAVGNGMSMTLSGG